MTPLWFDIHIAAPRQRVWERMLAKPSYEQWTAAFCEGSSYQGDWSPGSEMRFTGPDGSGMLAEVVQNLPGERVQIRHRGELLPGGTVQPGDGWDSADESYFFSDEAGGTRLRVQMDCAPAHAVMMSRMWPDALVRLKALCERDPA
jgi:uncharacterized protein YndB with AHSA1/START domain